MKPISPSLRIAIALIAASSALPAGAQTTTAPTSQQSPPATQPVAAAPTTQPTTQPATSPTATPTTSQAATPTTSQAATPTTSQAATTAPSGPQKPTDTLPADHPQRSAWTTMKVFLIRMDEARNNPERVVDAIECLDTSKLDPEDVYDAAPRLAEQLAEIINYHGVTLDTIADDWHAPPYVYMNVEEGEIILERSSDARWKFTADTVASIPALYQSIRKKATTQHVEVADSIPAERRSARQTITTFLEAVENDEINAAIEYLDLKNIPENIRPEVAPRLVRKLTMLLTKSGKGVVRADLPDEPNGLAYSHSATKTGRIEVARQESGDRKGQWLFTAKTVDSIERLYLELEAKAEKSGQSLAVDFWDQPSLWIRSKIHPSLKGELLYVQYWQWLALGAVLVAGLIAKFLATWLLRAIIAIWLRLARVEVDASHQFRVLRPFAVFAMVGIWYAGLSLIELGPRVETILWPATKLVFSIVGIWASYQFIDLVFAFIAARMSSQLLRVNVLLIPLISKLSKLVVTAIGAIYVARALGASDKEVNTLLAGLGLGGLALTLAAQDTIRNFFGSFVVVLDPSFRIGDWIRVGDVEGQVESVGLRSMRLRTPDDSQVTIPNGNLIGASVENLGARRYRRVRSEIAISHKTPPALVEAFCAGVRELIRQQPTLATDQSNVFVSAITGKSIEIQVTGRIETTSGVSEQRERHRFLLDIVRLARRLRIDFADGAGSHAAGDDDLLHNLTDRPDDAIRVGKTAAEAVIALVGGYAAIDGVNLAIPGVTPTPTTPTRR